MNNALAQSEELLALKSIYEAKDLIWDDGEPPCGRFIANVQLNNPFYIYCGEETSSEEFNKDLKCKFEGKIKVQYLPPLNLVFEFPETYPSTTCPAFLLSCSWLTINQLSKLCKHLEVLWGEGCGEVVLFRWIQFLQEETLKFLEIYNCLDITELSKCSLKTNFINSIESDSQTVSKLSSSSLDTKVNSDVSLETEEIQLPSSNLEPSDIALKLKLPHCNKNIQVEDLNIAMDNIKLSISGGCGVKDKRAFLDLPDGRKLLKLILDFEKFKHQENFEMTWHNCKICFLDKKGCDFVKFRGCDHTYCKECLQLYFEVQIKEGNVHLLNCPEEKCTSQADGTLVKQLVRTDLYDKYDNLLLSRTLEGMSDIAYCPRQVCQCPLLIDSAGRIGMCPACSFVFCPYCKMAYHGIAPCNFKSEEKQKICSSYMKGDLQQKEEMEKRYGKRAMQALVNDTLSENWMKSFSKNCPQCNASIEKTDGCNKMTCFRCGTYFCWLCMSPLRLINPYLHFNNVKSQCYGLLFPDNYLDGAFEIEPGEFLNLD